MGRKVKEVLTKLPAIYPPKNKVWAIRAEKFILRTHLETTCKSSYLHS